jgi:hypothetical protein
LLYSLAKAIWATLKHYGIHNAMMNTWSERVAFLTPGLDHRKVILNFKQAVTLFDTFETTLGDKCKDIVSCGLRVLLGFMVPMLEDTENPDQAAAAELFTPWFFEKSGAKSNEMMLRLLTSMEKSKTWAKLRDQRIKHFQRGEKNYKIAEAKKTQAAEDATKVIEEGGAMKQMKRAEGNLKKADKLLQKAEAFKRTPVELESWVEMVDDKEKKGGKLYSRPTNVFEDCVFLVHGVLTSSPDSSSRVPADYKSMICQVVFVMLLRFLFEGKVVHRQRTITKCLGKKRGWPIVDRD